MTESIFAAMPQQLRDIEYAQSTAGASLRFDASLPGTDSPAPAAIIVHGGAWVRGDRRTNVAPLFKPLSDAGFAWFSISYSLATNPLQVGTAVADVQAAVRFIKNHAADYHIDPDRIALIGESAGGQLAAMAALDGESGNGVKAVVALYTPTDLVALARSSSFIPEELRKQVNGTPLERILLARLGQLSPITSVRKGMPPFLLIHGDNDQIVPIEQSRLMCERMTAAGADCKLFTVPGAGHGIRWWESSSAKSGPYKQEMVQWLQKQCGVSLRNANN
ncbi:MAG: alpha/beta hydrolase [Acidobacteria bacterium]|nr:alpha/beta hydrolase [Acidobacteriota bacterium]